VNNFLLLPLFILGGLLYFSGLGWFISTLLVHDPNEHEAIEFSLIQKLPLQIIVGMITNYGIMLIFQSIRTSLIIGSVFAIAGLIITIRNLVTSPTRFKLDNQTIGQWIGVIITSSVLLIPFLVEPISRYDARTIWFFHSKMIYYAETIGLEAGWQNPFINFSHRDYPNLVPGIASQISIVAGYWNEYLPKLSIYLVLIPGIMWIFSFAKNIFSFLALLAFIPFSFAPWLWNGYMDGLLAFFFCIALLMIGEYFRTLKPFYLTSALACLILMMNIKNEGVLALLSLLLGLVISLLFVKQQVKPHELFKNYWKTIVGLVMLIIPFFIWSFYKQKWGLVNDLGIGSVVAFLRLFARIKEGTFSIILKSEFAEIIEQLVIFSLILFASASWKINLPKSVIPAVLTTSLYLLGISVIYLITPRDLRWHLNTSVSRTMMTVNGGIIVGWYVILENIEELRFSFRSKITQARLEKG